ncbi:hypothetical protein [Vibrio mediterranei]|uniref:hypothetical protein n=1 Tax=Vibrio mediterranei TaxID=689 RepID=UPI00148E7401|nr:hypothetical protein [Vibrio mediterranei]NOH31564.1 hypothetical protein [Vibrio mediterranei]
MNSIVVFALVAPIMSFCCWVMLNAGQDPRFLVLVGIVRYQKCLLNDFLWFGLQTLSGLISKSAHKLESLPEVG